MTDNSSVDFELMMRVLQDNNERLKKLQHRVDGLSYEMREGLRRHQGAALRPSTRNSQPGSAPIRYGNLG